jgi:hypothetical protein
MNDLHVTGFEVAPEASVKLNQGIYDVSKGCVDLWIEGMKRDCTDPMYLTQANSEVFTNESNNVEALAYADLIGSGLWHKKDENENVQQGAAKLGKIITVYPCDFAKDLVITRPMDRLNRQSGGRLVQNWLKDFIEKARKTDEIASMNLIADPATYSATVTTAANNQTYSTLVTVNGVATGTVPTPAQFEQGLEAAQLALMNQKDSDGFTVSCTGTKVVVVSNDLFIAASKALAIRSDNCCGPNGMQLSSVRGLKLFYNPELPAGTALVISSQANFVRDVVEALNVEFRPSMYNDAHKAVYRGYFAHRYFKRGLHGAVKVQFVA